jgi:hypothetical protein
VAVGGGEAVAGQDEPPGQQRPEHRDGPGRGHEAGQGDGLGRERGGRMRHRRQRGADHAAVVLVADDQHGQDGERRLAELDADEAELGHVAVAAGGGAGLLIPVALALGWFVAGRFLHPLRAITARELAM